MKTHEDDRRKLVDWSDGLETKTCKVIVAKEDCTLGKHYHKLKTERFMLVHGEAEMERDTELMFGKMHSNFRAQKHSMALHLPYVVVPNVVHTFYLKKGAVLIALIDRVYDPEDDYTE